ncbi:MAG: hypothetical protein AAGD96_22990 [Chloroflexota bacterium]
MNKKIYLMILFTFALVMAGCASPDAGTGPVVEAGQTVQTAGLSADFADAMPVINQLAAGTVALENGGNAVTDEQAAQLLPLWQAYSGLSADGGAAQAELDALSSQIERAMTEEQISEIASLQLTNAKLQEMIEAGEIQLGRGQGRGGFGGEGQGGQGQGGQGGGGRGQGGIGGGQGGQGGGGIGNLSQDDIATRRAERVEAVGGEDAFLAAQVSGAVVRILNVKVNGEQDQPQQGQNPFQVANQTVADALGMSVDELVVAAAEGSIQSVIEASDSDLEALKATLSEALDETRAGQNGDLDGFIENYLASNGVGRGGPQGGGN